MVWVVCYNGVVGEEKELIEARILEARSKKM